MPEIRTVCVYCGTREGGDPAHVEAASVLGRALAGTGIALVYGGASIGVMGALARAALDAGGRVTGVIPDFLTGREQAFTDVTELIVTASMHDRKQRMFDMADAFVALPGGIGTLEELVEVMTWFQLGRHAKPIVLGNIQGFWDPLIELLGHMRDEGFIAEGRDVRYRVAARAEDIVPLLIDGSARSQAAETPERRSL